MGTTLRSGNRTTRGDRGIAVVFFALAIGMMMTVAALVLGGSVGYTAVRNAQTAADAAALAGTTVLRQHKQDWITTPADRVLAEVQSVVQKNGAALAPGGCDLVKAEYALDPSDANVIARCDQLGSLSDDQFQKTAGVRVKVRDARDVPFGAFVKSQTITGSAVAAATAQPVAQGKSPFMVCTASTATGHPAQALLPIASGYKINPDAVGKLYVLHGNQVKYGGRDCKTVIGDSDWRGLVKFNMTFPLPSPSDTNDEHWWQTESGNSNGNLPINLAGDDACELSNQDVYQLKVGCRIAVPLCPKSNNNTSDFRLYCITMGAFRITHIGSNTAETEQPEYATPCGTVTNNIICGRFLGAANALGGVGRAETPDTNGVAIVKLVQ